MNTYKLNLQYKGTGYCGWQIQDSDKTIQGELNRALSILSKTDDVKSIGSGRTDAGVHAISQIVKIEIPVSIPADSLTSAINSHLPLDIRVKSAEVCGHDFHPIFSAKAKTYKYVFTTNSLLSPFASDFVVQVHHEFDFDKMKRALEILKGSHDFLNFSTKGTEVKTTVREIFDCHLDFQSNIGLWSDFCPEYYVLSFRGEGFLKQMVRLLVGALWSIGRGKVSLNDFENALKGGPINQRLGAVAPPQGLYLYSVEY